MTSAISGRHAGNNPATSCQRPSHNSDVISISDPYGEIYFAGRGKFTSLSVIGDTEGCLGERIVGSGLDLYWRRGVEEGLWRLGEGDPLEPRRL
jgi:hypothetical protein